MNPLLAAVLASPDDDTPRLVYADWLEEQGEGERAKFIRAQIEEAQTWLGKARIMVSAYLGSQPWKVEESWVGKDGNVIQCVWYRGFIDHIFGPLASLLEHGPAIVRENPVTSVRVTDKKPKANRWYYPANDEIEPNAPDVLNAFMCSDMCGANHTPGSGWSGWGHDSLRDLWYNDFGSQAHASMALSDAVLRVLRERAASLSAA